MAQIRKEFEDAILTHTHELEEVNRKHARELEEANQKHARDLAEVRAKAKEGERNGVLLPSSFTKKLRAKGTWDPFKDDPRWHFTNVGDIFYTDGISRRETFHRANGIQSEFPCYLGKNSFGKLAFICKADVDFC